MSFEEFLQTGQHFQTNSMSLGRGGGSIRFHHPIAWTERKPGQLPPPCPWAVFRYEDLPHQAASWTVPYPGRKPPVYSFVTGLVEGRAMWFDFNDLAKGRDEVAILVETQNMNAISGLQHNLDRLEAYQHRCPIHDCELLTDNYCPQCGENFPSQNYLASTGTPSGLLWLDGFRSQEDGKVKQWMLTADVREGVAARRIGVANINFTIRFALFHLKEEHRTQPDAYEGGARGGSSVMSKSPLFESYGLERSSPMMMGLHIGEGVEIDQHIFPDTHKPEHWEDLPFATVVLNYVNADYLSSLLEDPRLLAAQRLTV